MKPIVVGWFLTALLMMVTVTCQSALGQTTAAKRFELFGFRATHFDTVVNGVLFRDVSIHTMRIDHDSGTIVRCMMNVTYRGDTAEKADAKCVLPKFGDAGASIGTGNIGVIYHSDFDAFQGPKQKDNVSGSPPNVFGSTAFRGYWLINHNDGKLKGCVNGTVSGSDGPFICRDITSP